ncbi:MAG: F0F1 ATP synthase subunit A [Bacteroidales bacterium]|nr:F0F1 ATP synthase subunit A [Bacteroidales bacterium]
MKTLKKILLVAVVLLLPFKAGAVDMDMQEYLFGHIGDGYGWHITTINGNPVTINLPVIVHSKTSGWHCFSSKHIAEGETYDGFRIAAKGEPHEGKLVEIMPSGELVKPLDISITKNVFGLMVNSLLVVLIILLAARWYRRHDATQEAPKGFTGIIEMIVTMVEDDIIKECVGKDYKRYSPYLLTAFFFIFINNLMGIVPFFPGGANITGNIAITLTLALCTFIAVNLFGNKHYWKDILWPDVPVYLKAFPLMPLIEIIGMFTKPFSLMIRLFANILAGHVMLLGVVAVVFLTAELGAAMNAGLSAIAVFFGVFMDVLELLVAFLQAYVFTMLSAVFIGLSRQEPETE